MQEYKWKVVKITIQLIKPCEKERRALTDEQQRGFMVAHCCPRQGKLPC